MELEYPERLQRLLLKPMREMSVELVLHKDNGDIEVGRARVRCLPLRCLPLPCGPPMPAATL